MPTTDGDNIEGIIGYLALHPAGEEVHRITGLTETTSADVLNGQTIPDPTKRRPGEVVVPLARPRAAGRGAPNGTADRGQSSAMWLQSGPVNTSRGTNTPLEVLTGTDLATDALPGLRR